jgi:hypothetical protein
MHRVQEPQLRDDEEQEDDAGTPRIQEVLPTLPLPHGTQRDQVNDERGAMSDELKDKQFRVHRSEFIVS